MFLLVAVHYRECRELRANAQPLDCTPRERNEDTPPLIWCHSHPGLSADQVHSGQRVSSHNSALVPDKSMPFSPSCTAPDS